MVEFLVTIALILVIVCFYKINKLTVINKEIQRLYTELQAKYKLLEDKTQFNYYQIKRLTNTVNYSEGEAHTQQKASSTSTVVVEKNADTATTVTKDSNSVTEGSVPVQSVHNNVGGSSSIPMQNNNNNAVASTANSFNPYATEKAPQARVAGQPQFTPNTTLHNETANRTPIVKQDMPYNSNATGSTYNYSRANSTAQNRADSVYVQQPVIQTKTTSQPIADNKKVKSVENWIGTRLLNIVASLLIFIGLIMFCTLDIHQTVKITGMHLISAGVIALGAILTKKNKSIFSLGLTGCGFGALFITILVTHIYFQAIPDFVAFGMLLLWIIAALIISKMLDSVMLSVTAHMGMAVSVCFAFTLGFSEERIILPVIYQLASITVIILGNIFCCKKTYRFGLLMSMSLLIYSSIVMHSTIDNSILLLGGLSVGMTILLFSIQTLGISFISYLLSVSTTKLYDSRESDEIKNLPISIHIVNKSLWVIGIYASVFCVISTIFEDLYNASSSVYPAAAMCVLAILHLAVTLFMSEKLNFNEMLANISIWFNSILFLIFAVVHAVCRDTLSDVPFIFVFAAAIILIIKYTKNRKLNSLVTFLLGFDMLFMTLFGYNSLIKDELTVGCFMYLLITCATIFFHWFNQGEESKENNFLLFKTIEYLWVHISLVAIAIVSINNSEGSYYQIKAITFTALSLINIIAFICNYSGQGKSYLSVIIKITTSVVIFYSYGIFVDFPLQATVSILMISSVALSTIFVVKLVKEDSTLQQVYAGIICTSLLTALCLKLSEAGLSIFLFADIYVNQLYCIPVFFITALAMLAILRVTKNYKLNLFIIIALGIDALLMLTVGYRLLGNSYLSDIYNNSVGENGGQPHFVLCILHLLVFIAVVFYLWNCQTKETRDKQLLTLKSVEYFWLLASSMVIVELSDFFDRSVLALIISVGINLIAYILKYSGKEKSYLSKCITVISVILLYASFYEMSFRISQGSETYVFNYILRFTLMLLCAGIYLHLGREWIKSSSALKQIITGLTFTIFVNSFCSGLSSVFDIDYVASIISMMTALICIIIGFALQVKGLRLYGLLVTIICVLKLVTFDISTTSSTARFLAFILGGIICFAISGLYNHAERRLNQKVPILIDVTNDIDVQKDKQ